MVYTITAPAHFLLDTVATRASNDPRKAIALIITGVAIIAMAASTVTGTGLTGMVVFKLAAGTFFLSAGISARRKGQLELDILRICQQFMTTFAQDFKPLEVKTYTFDRLYREDVQSIPEERQAMQQVFNTLWGVAGRWDEIARGPEDGIFGYRGKLPEGWKKHSGSNRSLNIENPQYPGYIFKCCTGSPGIGSLSAHFLRVPKGKEIGDIIIEDHLDELEVVDETLIALQSQAKIQEVGEYRQCYVFVVKSKKINLLDEKQTAAQLTSYDEQRQLKIANQVAQVICKSGLGDIGFHNLNINKDTGRLVFVDTEPLFGGLFLDEKPRHEGQYGRTEEVRPLNPNLRSVDIGLKNMIKWCADVPIFVKVAKAYRAALHQQYPTFPFKD
jgi:hypothetical protein